MNTMLRLAALLAGGVAALAAASARADIIQLAGACQALSDFQKSENQCTATSGPVTFRAPRGFLQFAVFNSESACPTVQVRIEIDRKPVFDNVLKQGQSTGALRQVGLAKAGTHTVTAEYTAYHRVCKGFDKDFPLSFKTEIAMDSDPPTPPDFLLVVHGAHGERPDQLEAGDTVFVQGRNWDRDGADIRVRIEGRKVTRIPAESAHAWALKLKLNAFPPDDCMLSVRATQASGGGTVEREALFGGRPVARVFFADAMKITQGKRDRRMKDNSFICEDEAEHVKLLPHAVFAGMRAGERQVIGPDALDDNPPPGFQSPSSPNIFLPRDGMVFFSRVDNSVALGLSADLIRVHRTRGTVAINLPPHAGAVCTAGGVTCEDTPGGVQGDLTLEGFRNYTGALAVNGKISLQNGAADVNGTLTVTRGIGGRGRVVSTGIMKVQGPVNVVSDDGGVALGSLSTMILCGTLTQC